MFQTIAWYITIAVGVVVVAVALLVMFLRLFVGIASLSIVAWNRIRSLFFVVGSELHSRTLWRSRSQHNRCLQPHRLPAHVCRSFRAPNR